MFPTADAVFKAYRAGTLDGAVLPPSDLTTARSMQGFRRVPELETDYITPNAGLPPFNNLHCRLAVAYAIDRATVNSAVLHGSQGALYDMLPPGLPGYIGREPGVPAYDPARARRERAQCPGGLHNVRLLVQNTPDVVREYNAIRGELNAIGASVTVAPVGLREWLGATSENMSTAGHPQHLVENLWIADYPDPSDWLSNQMRSNAPDNIGNFRNAQYDSLVDRADVDQNATTRAGLYRQAQRIALKGGYWISVGYVNGLFILPPRIHGLVVSNGSVWPVGNDWSKVSIGGS
jgi:ABC-type transport system substrate-binding protein